LDPCLENSQLLIPFSILVTSFLGSWHCAGMCGPFAALTGSRGQLWQYHLGRLIAYVALGAASGALGKVFLITPFAWLRTLGAIAIASMLILLGLQYYFNLGTNNSSHTRAGVLFQSIYRKLYRFKVARTSFMIGLMAGILPCVWLYTYVLAAVSSQSPMAGSIVMSLFWLGGLPALSAVSLMIHPALKVAGQRKQRIAGLVLVVAGLYALGSHFVTKM